MNDEKLGGADLVELKDGTKVIILGDVHHHLAEELLRHLPMPVEHITVLADAVINGSPRRRAELMRTTFAEIYGERALKIADIYDEFDTEHIQAKKGHAPDFIKERNQQHWKHGRK